MSGWISRPCGPPQLNKHHQLVNFPLMPHIEPYLEILHVPFPQEVPVSFIKGKVWVEVVMDHCVIRHSITGDRIGQGAVVRVCKVRFAHI